MTSGEGDDADVVIDWILVWEWGLGLLVLLSAAVLIGLFTARLFLRATDTRAQRR